MAPGLTVDFAEELHALGQLDLPANVAGQAASSMLNVLGTAVGASQRSAVDKVVAVGQAHGGAPSVPVLGRSEQLDVLHAAIANGFAAHLDDFDDTHLGTLLHPGAATLAAALSSGVARRAEGQRVLRAFALGCEAQIRVAIALSPAHYDDGWDITGTCAPIGAAVTAGLLAELGPQSLAHALGMAASQTLGQRENFGSMVKPFHPGKGAANGILAVLLAERGFSAQTDTLEDSRGYFAVLSPQGHRPTEVLDDIGHHWELAYNSFKPYPAEVVAHPLIDAALELSRAIEEAGEIIEIEASVHPLVSELTDNLEPQNGLQARFSAAHGIAVALLDGTVGLAQYQDERVRAADAVDMRRSIRFLVDPAIRRDAGTVRVWLADRSVREAHIAHARGSADRALTDEELKSKVNRLVEPVLPGRTDPLVAAIRNLPEAPSLDSLLSACRP